MKIVYGYAGKWYLDGSKTRPYPNDKVLIPLFRFIVEATKDKERLVRSASKKHQPLVL